MWTLGGAMPREQSTSGHHESTRAGASGGPAVKTRGPATPIPAPGPDRANRDRDHRTLPRDGRGPRRPAHCPGHGPDGRNRSGKSSLVWTLSGAGMRIAGRVDVVGRNPGRLTAACRRGQAHRPRMAARRFRTCYGSAQLKLHRGDFPSSQRQPYGTVVGDGNRVTRAAEQVRAPCPANRPAGP